MLNIKNLRLLFFKIFDNLTGNKKRENYLDIKQIIEKNDSSKTDDYLNKILQHATKTTSYYNEYSKNQNIKDFPVVNKNIIKDNFNLFQSKTYKTAKNRTVKTSGSTGTPFKLYQDKNKIIRNSADNLYFSELAGYSLGNKLYYFRMWDAFERKGAISEFIQNIVPIDVFNLNDEYIKKFILQLKKNKSKKSWIGYASSFEKISKYLVKNNIKPFNCNLKSAIAISESLNPYTKDTLKKYLNVETISRYSNVENGIIAQQLLGKDYFLINQASYHVEILNFDNNDPVEEGNSGRIVITDLFNYSVPMIRYDTGDVGIIKTIDNNLVLTKVEGRKIDLITNTKGEIISENLILLVNNYHELNQCQLIQKTSNKYLFKINLDGDFKNKNKFIEEFKNYLGQDAIINIEYVNEIPLLASGKRRVMINETLQKK